MKRLRSTEMAGVDSTDCNEQGPSSSRFALATAGPNSMLSEKLKTNIKETFEMFDFQGNGFIDAAIVKYAMREIGHNPSEEELKRMIAAVVKGPGKISFNDFEKLVIMRMAECKGTGERIKPLPLFTEDQASKISIKNLKRVAREMGETLTDEELQELIDVADRNNNGEVTLAELMRIVERTSLY